MSTNNNKKNGNHFEEEFCELLALHGFWAHNMAQNQVGQPADVIAVKNGIPVLIDCNLSLAYCDDCGHEELEMDVCPVCGSTNLTKIDRMNGYLSYSRVHGDTRLNAAKMAEIAERKSM